MAGAANGSQCHCHSATLHRHPNHYSCLIFISHCSLLPDSSHLSSHILCSFLLPPLIELLALLHCAPPVPSLSPCLLHAPGVSLAIDA